MTRLTLAMLVLLCGCAAAPYAGGVHPRPRVVRVAIQPGVWDGQESLIRNTIASMGIPGVRLEFVDTNAHVRVIRWANLPCDPPRPHCHARGCYEHPANVIYLDPAMLPADVVWIHVVIHEVLHYLGALHVCRVPHESPVCSTVGYGVAIMNPSVGVPEWVANGKYRNAPLTALTALDWAELRRAGIIGTRMP